MTTAPYSLIISMNAKLVPLKVVLNGGGINSGNPPVTLPEVKKYTQTILFNYVGFNIALPVNLKGVLSSS